MHDYLVLLRPCKVMQLDLGPDRKRVEKFARRQIHFGGIQQRPLAIVTQLFMPFHDAVPNTLDGGARIIDVDEHTVRRQVFE